MTAEAVLWQMLGDHLRLGDCDVYVAGPAPLVPAAEFRLLDQGLPRAQLRVSALEA